MLHTSFTCLHTQAMSHAFRDIVRKATLPTLGCYQKLGSLQDDVFDKLFQRDIQQSVAAFEPQLKWCITERDLLRGKPVHCHIIRSNLEQNTSLGILVLQLYCDCGALDDAWQVFVRMEHRTVSLWSVILAASVQHGQVRHAFQLFQQMSREGIAPNRFILITLITACSTDPAYLIEGRWLHHLVLSCRLELDLIAGNALISMYGKYGSIADALKTFNCMPLRDVISWNAMISAYAKQGQALQAYVLLEQMEQTTCPPDKFTFIGILSAFNSPDNFVQGTEIHNHIVSRGFESDVTISNSLISMYGRCGSLECAERTFDGMVERTIVSWTSIIAVYSQHGERDTTFRVFNQMQEECVIPNMITYSAYFNVCGSKTALRNGKRKHAQLAITQMKLDVIVETALLSMYSNCGCFESALNIFINMSERSTISWSIMISAYKENGLAAEASQLIAQMLQQAELTENIIFVSILDVYACQFALQEGKQAHSCLVGSGIVSDVVLQSTLANMYAKCGCMEDAQQVFDSMLDRNSFSWNVMITGYCQHEEGVLVLQLFQQMQQECVLADKVTYVSMFNACGSDMNLILGKRLHCLLSNSVFLADIVLWNSIVTFYGKCGSIEDAQSLFNRCTKKSVVSWNAMITAYAQNGCGKECLFLFNQMKQEGTSPNTVTLTVILSACSHAGLVDEASYLFDRIVLGCCNIPAVLDHYNCMIDILGRAGRLDEAECLLRLMPCTPTTISSMTLLSACRFQSDAKRGEDLIQTFEMDLAIASPFVVLSHVYATAESSGDASRWFHK